MGNPAQATDGSVRPPTMLSTPFRTDVTTLTSRWQAQIGLRYLFNQAPAGRPVPSASGGREQSLPPLFCAGQGARPRFYADGRPGDTPGILGETRRVTNP
ncbi:MAG: hypothetical protein WKG07_03345 [Hymenobacter sp.]